MKNLLLTSLLGLVLAACTSETPGTEATPPPLHVRNLEIARDFFDTFSERKDWDKLLSFYREDLVMEDIILQMRFEGLEEFKGFYNWPDTNFHKLTPEQEHLAIESLLADDSTAVARGHLNPFYWQGELVDVPWGMEFTIWLYLDEAGKIYRQIDWFEYDAETHKRVLKGLGHLPSE